MDPKPKDIHNRSPDAVQADAVPTDVDAALETRAPEATNNDATRPHHHDGSYGGVNEATGRQRTESADGRFVVADDDGTSPAAAGTTVTVSQLLPSQQAVYDDCRNEGSLSPSAEAITGDRSTPPNLAASPVADGESITDAVSLEEVHAAESSSADMVNSPISSAAPQQISSKHAPSSPNSTRSSPAPSEGSGGETDGGRQSSAEHNGQNRAEVELHDESEQDVGDGFSGEEDEPGDLPSQLSRVWGASPPDRAEKLAVIQDMLGYRGELDGILSKLMSVKVRGRPHGGQPSTTLLGSTETFSSLGSRSLCLSSGKPNRRFPIISFNTQCDAPCERISCPGTRPRMRSPRGQRGNPGHRQLPDVTIRPFSVHPGDPRRSFRPGGDRSVGAA